MGWLSVRWEKMVWHLPEFERAWLVVIFLIPQLLAFYIPATRNSLSTTLVAVCLIVSQIGLFLFCLLNRHLPGIPILAAGLFLNLIVITANGGLMPISTVTAQHLFPDQVLSNLKVGSRVSLGSKDILLPPDAIVLPWLADRFVSPEWFSNRIAFSLGDVLINIGAFLLLALPTNSKSFFEKGRI